VDTTLIPHPAKTLDVSQVMGRAMFPPESAAPVRVAVLEHDEGLREHTLVPGLRRRGFEVEPIGNLRELQQVLLESKFDLCVLDSVLSAGDGISLPHWLRSQYPQMGVVILSDLGDTYDHLRGLNEGGDAYLLKTTPIDIVAATLSSVARRLQPPSSSIPAPAGRHAPQWQLQSDGWCLVAPDGAQATLTISERRLVQVLWDNAGNLVTRDALMRAVSNDDSHIDDIDPHGLDVLLYRLRRKVQSRTGQALPLEVIRGAGYILHPSSASLVPAS